MRKVTLFDNLFPCQNPLPEGYAPHFDLAQNPLLAAELINIALVLFQLKEDGWTFTGYAHEMENGVLTMRLVHDGRFIHSVALYDTGFAGFMEVETATLALEDAVDLDLFAGLKAYSQKVMPVSR